MIHLPSLPAGTLANSALAGKTHGNRENHRGGQGGARPLDQIMQRTQPW
jgi:hypothetical protein